MRELNIPSKDVYAETTSYDTISNAFFTRTNFCDLTGWKRLLIITNEFHLQRTELIFDWIMNVPNSRSPSLDDSEKYELYYLSVPDQGLSDEAVKVRNEKEQKSADNVKNILTKEYTTLGGVFDFITRNHSFYNAEKLVERANKVLNPKDVENLKILRQSYGGLDNSRIELDAINSGGVSSFAQGTFFGIALAAACLLLKSFGRGAKMHSK